MFWFRDTFAGAAFGFTDASLDLGRQDDESARAARERVGRSLGATRTVAMRQVHGDGVVDIDEPPLTPPEADAMVTSVPRLGLMVRVADCTPIVLIDAARPRVGVVHAGRDGLVRGVVPAGVRAMGSDAELHAWVGPRVCGRCYELPERLADAVETAVPGTRCTTSWGTPAIDVGAGVVTQLEALGVTVHDLGAHECTIENESLCSHRRDAERAGRMGAAVSLT